MLQGKTGIETFLMFVEEMAGNVFETLIFFTAKKTLCLTTNPTTATAKLPRAGISTQGIEA